MHAAVRLAIAAVVMAGVVLPLRVGAQSSATERLATPFVESGRPVTLEAPIFRPQGPPPFPVIVFLHGSTGRGEDPRKFNETWAPATLAKFFTDRGWLVVFPQRRGRGASDGTYDEGFTSDRSRYACEPQHSQSGFERAIADVDASITAIVKRGDVDPRRIVVAGQSRGGILAIAYAGLHPERVVGAINFVGGWMGEWCRYAAQLNGGNFARGASFQGATLWLYGEGDRTYSIVHTRGNFDRFVAAGGRGTYHALDVGPEGHGVWRFQTAWAPIVDAYLNLAAPVAAERQRVPIASSTATKPTPWPALQARLSAGAAITPNLAVLPAEQPVVPPAADVPAAVRGLSGRWSGWVGSGASGSVAIAVEQMSGVTAVVAFSYADATTAPSHDRTTFRVVNGDELQGRTFGARLATLRQRTDGHMDVLIGSGESGTWTSGIATRQPR